MRIIETLDQFMEWVKQFTDRQYLFRGVSSECYKLEASISRRLSSQVHNTAADLLDITKELIDSAREQGHDEKNGRQLHDLELLAELQHYGAATCLMDFSRNPLVALWFACQDSSEEEQKNGKVFAIRIDDPLRLEEVTHDFIEQKIGYFFERDRQGNYPLYQWVPKFQNNRIIAQRSVFIFGGSKIEAFFECVITLKNKQEILKNLNELFDISEASMFPDFDGFARQHAHDKSHSASSPQGYLQRGIKAHQRRNLDNAILYYSNVIKLDPVDRLLTATAYYKRGHVYRDQGNLDQAIADYDKTLELNPDYVEAYSYRGAVLKDQGDCQGAIESFNRAIELNSTSALLYLNRGVTYHSMDDTDNALADYNRVIELDPNYAPVYYYRGSLYSERGNDQRAIEDYNRTIELDPMYSRAYDGRAAIYTKRGNMDQAIADYDKVIELQPDSANAYTGRGLVYQQLGNTDQAIADYDKVIELQPDSANAYNNRGFIRSIISGPDSAIEDFNKAIELDPNHAVAHNNRGMMYQMRGDSDLAEADLRKARELWGAS